VQLAAQSLAVQSIGVLIESCFVRREEIALQSNLEFEI